jgi:hypothetical protein
VVYQRQLLRNGTRVKLEDIELYIELDYIYPLLFSFFIVTFCGSGSLLKLSEALTSVPERGVQLGELVGDPTGEEEGVEGAEVVSLKI